MPARMFSVEGMMGLRSWRYADGTAILRAVVAANSSIGDGVASALKPRRTRVSPYPAAATARANRISETAFQGFMSISPVPWHRRPPPERGEIPAEVQFEVARNAVTDIADLGTARLCAPPRPTFELAQRSESRANLF